jgi:hypothetical protein
MANPMMDEDLIVVIIEQVELDLTHVEGGA